ncbi:TonB-dependent receptor plug domain-containing protein [Thiobacter aerophilum]|uniref:TonB-dependent receptor n=1 Tax=Thiobacter aerophilum TaxID=3121275 RepID=A0ABV0EBE6_9BURK
MGKRHISRAVLRWGCVACAALSQGLYAAGARLSEDDFLGEVPVVLSVSRLAQPAQDAPSAVTVIDRETIVASGFREIADLMRLVPGFYVGYAAGNDVIVSHGLSNAYFGRLQVLIDGRSVYTPAWGQVRWPMLPLSLEDVERIEVTRGPNAASYGANAFTGIINIITRHPAQDRGTVVSLTGGDPHLKDALVRHAGQWGGWQFSVSAGHREDTGFDTRNDSQDTDFVLIRGERVLDTTNSVQLQAGYRGGRLGVGWFGDTLDMPRDRHAATGFAQVRWQRTVSPEDELAVQFYYSFDRNREQFVTMDSMVPTTLRLVEDSERYDIEVQKTQTLSPRLRAVWGGSIRQDRIHAPAYLGTDDTRVVGLQRLFGHGEWRPVPEWTFNLGAMVEHNDLAGTDVAPRWAATWHVLPQHSVRLGVSQAQRTPTLLEYAADYKITLNKPGGGTFPPFQWYVGTHAASSERITTREIAYLGTWPDLHLALDVRLYEDRIRNIILADAIGGGSWSFKDGNWLTRRGVETQLSWHVQTTRLTLAHSFTQIRSAGGPVAYAERDLQRADPRHTFGALLAHRFPYGIDASVGVYYYDDMTPFGNTGDYIRAYTRRDLRVAKRFKLGVGQGELALVFQNMDGPYHDFSWDPSKPLQRNEFPRRTLFTLKVGY